MDIQFQPATTEAQIARIATLAREIWYEYYVALIGRAQVDYMVARFQSASAMLEQLGEGHCYFTIESDSPGATEVGQPLGYFAIQPQPSVGKLFISKLYVCQSGRGRGTGRRTLEFIERRARAWALEGLWLTVNKGNPSIAAYRRWGFRVTEAIVMDIGGGFVMDDYRMEKAIEASLQP